MDDAVVAQTGPYMMELVEGQKYAWCRCGRSGNQPLCDGAHSATDLKPVVFTAEKTEIAYLCGCKQTGGQPFCDGTHNELI